MRRMKRLILAGLLVAVLLPATGEAGTRVYVKIAPPAPKAAAVHKAGGHLVWIAGYWRYNGTRYVWVNGHYVKARKGQVWVPAHWNRDRHGWYFVPGHWRRA